MGLASNRIPVHSSWVQYSRWFRNCRTLLYSKSLSTSPLPMISCSTYPLCFKLKFRPLFSISLSSIHFRSLRHVSGERIGDVKTGENGETAESSDFGGSPYRSRSSSSLSSRVRCPTFTLIRLTRRIDHLVNLGVGLKVKISKVSPPFSDRCLLSFLTVSQKYRRWGITDTTNDCWSTSHALALKRRSLQ